MFCLQSLHVWFLWIKVHPLFCLTQFYQSMFSVRPFFEHFFPFSCHLWRTMIQWWSDSSRTSDWEILPNVVEVASDCSLNWKYCLQWACIVWIIWGHQVTFLFLVSSSCDKIWSEECSDHCGASCSSSVKRGQDEKGAMISPWLLSEQGSECKWDLRAPDPLMIGIDWSAVKMITLISWESDDLGNWLLWCQRNENAKRLKWPRRQHAGDSSTKKMSFLKKEEDNYSH